MSKIIAFHGCCCDWRSIIRTVIGYRILNGKTPLYVLIYLFIGIIISNQLDARRVVNDYKYCNSDKLSNDPIHLPVLVSSNKFKFIRQLSDPLQRAVHYNYKFVHNVVIFIVG